ncbi:MAG: hypothetical protein JKY93_01450, partial [Gammaproteobacteria bacterium]|nr:hypothetical protein [Gammaproteobacteria bacterium]
MISDNGSAFFDHLIQLELPDTADMREVEEYQEGALIRLPGVFRNINKAKGATAVSL